MNQALYAHMNNKRKMEKKKEECYDHINLCPWYTHCSPESSIIGALSKAVLVI
jgi:hypothetical protein